MREQAHPREDTPFQPVRLLEVELSHALPAVPAFDPETGRVHTRAEILVRLHTQPLGVTKLALGVDDLSPDAFAAEIWTAHGETINAHLRLDGLPELTGLTAAGVPFVERPACLRSEEQLLARAPFVSVIVCTRDRPEQMTRCLSALMSVSYPRYEILVVDNAARTTAVADLVRQHEGSHPCVRYVREDRPGLSWARNCGLRHALGEVTAFVDDDEAPDANWLTEIAKGFEIAPDVTCVTGSILPAEIETPVQDWFEQFGGASKGRGFEIGIFNTTTHRVQNPLFPAPAFGAGGNMAFRTTTLRAMGGFDPALGSGTPARSGEDTAAFFDILTQGHTLVFQPTAVVRHRHHRSYEAFRKQLYGYSVGLTAFYTHCVVSDPRHIFGMMGIIPRALSYMFSSRSPRVISMRDDYPKEMDWLQRKGMLYGPVAYLVGRRGACALSRQPAAPDPDDQRRAGMASG